MKGFIGLGLAAAILLPAISNLACSDKDQDYAAYYGYLDTPRVTGLYIRDDFGYIVGIWKNPNPEAAFCSFGPRLYLMLGLEFPEFEPGQTSLKVWVVRALGPDDTEEDFNNNMGSAIYYPQATVATIVDSVYTGQGRMIISLSWEGNDEFGTPMPDGFFRIYEQLDDELRFGDFLLVREICAAPIGIRPERCD